MIFLYGHPRCGKTTLMQQSGVKDALDLDHHMLTLAKKPATTVQEIFMRSRDEFYALEKKAWADTLMRKPTLIALGGSTLLRLSTQNNTVIYLQEHPDTLEKRWAKDRALTQTTHNHLFYNTRHRHYLETCTLHWPNPTTWSKNLLALLK